MNHYTLPDFMILHAVKQGFEYPNLQASASFYIVPCIKSQSDSVCSVQPVVWHPPSQLSVANPSYSRGPLVSLLSSYPFYEPDDCTPNLVLCPRITYLEDFTSWTIIHIVGPKDP
jgi:hypothetical protein